MTPFRYHRDPVFLAACAVYAVNRWALKPHWHWGFLHDHLSDFLLIPAALPLVLLLQRRLGLRKNDGTPSGGEILFHLVVWTLVCEVTGPRLTSHAVGDWRDAVAYIAGAVLAWAAWHLPGRWRGEGPMDFAPVAPHYGWMERLLAGGKLQRARLTWLDDARDCRRVLLAGEGHGRFLHACLAALPKAEITCLDACQPMLDAAQRRCPVTADVGRTVRFIHATLPEWSPDRRGYDLIVTNFFFDCFTPVQLAEIIKSLAAAAAPGARWLVAEFHEPPRGWQRWRARAILALARSFFRLATRLPARSLPDHTPFLQEHGFLLQHRRETEWGLLVSESWRRAE